MFPSTNTSNNPFEFVSNKTPSLCDHQTTKQHLEPSFFLNFPSPFFDEHEFPLNDILPQNQMMPENHQNFVVNHVQKDSSDISTRKGKSTKRAILENQVVGQPIIKRQLNLAMVPRKRTGKKDRHSKIHTAQGIRDRRMRLSLQVARKFFDLQDMLGYDKASKTIEWLFTKSKMAIKELIQDHDPTIQANDNNVNIFTSEAKSESFQSECEVVSGIEETSNNIAVKEGILPTNLMLLCYDTPCETRDCGIKLRNPLAYKANSMKESRDKARARARCRTKAKMMIKELNLTNQLCKSLNPNNDDHKLGSVTNIPFEGVGQETSSINREMIFTYGADFTSSFEQQLADVGTIENLLMGNSSNPSRFCPISEYNNNQSYVSVSSCIESNFMGLIGHLDLVSSSQYSVTHQVSLAGSSSNSPFEGVDQKSISYTQERVSQFDADVGTIEKLLEINSSSPDSNAGNSFIGFLGNWEMLNNIDKLNSTSVTDHVSLAGKLNHKCKLGAIITYTANVTPI